MTIKRNVAIKPIDEKIKEKSVLKLKNRLCLCKVLSPTFNLLRIFGLFPIISKHERKNDVKNPEKSQDKEEDAIFRCKFQLSIPLLLYSLLICVLMSVELFFTTEILNIVNIHKDKSLHAILNAINDIVYSVIIVLLTFVNIIRYPRFVNTLNRLIAMRNENNLLCQSALKGIFKVQFITVIVFFIVLTVQYVIIFWLDSTEEYLTNFFDYKFYLNRLTINLFFGLHIIFINLTSIIVGMSGCFIKIASSSLNFEPQNPLKDVDGSSGDAEFFGFFRYSICNEHHSSPKSIINYTISDIIEFLRCLHEDISLLSYEINECLDPQFLIHIVLELSALIINWYAVILYLVYDFTSETAKTINILNIIVVTVHTIGLLTFLKHAQQLQNIVKNLIDFLLEFATKISTPEEHQQIRIFIHKLKIHRPLTASGVFNIDLGIAGPVFANILTYVLVALQFDVPKD